MSTTTPVRIPTETYTLDPLHSTVTFAVRYNGLAMFRSSFSKVEATLSGGVLSGSVDVDSLAIGMDRFKGHLLSADFFDVERFPKISFSSSEIDLQEDGSLTLEGELTLRGASHPVSATGRFGVAEDAFGKDLAGFSLRTVIDRRSFGLTWQNPLPSGEDAIDWNVELSVELQLSKADTEA